MEKLTVPDVNNKAMALAELDDKAWETIMYRYDIIAPILQEKNDVPIIAIAKQTGIARATIYRWLMKYKQTGAMTSLLDDDNSRNADKYQLADEVEEIIKIAIKNRYLKQQKLSISKIHREVGIACKAAGLTIPHYTTIRKRIHKVSDEEKMRRRKNDYVADNKYKPTEGAFPESAYPLQAVQVDHTPLDMIVVDEIYRKPVGRPWMTVAIDIYSRMVVGFYISLDPPGALGTGMCLSHAILSKALWLVDLDVKGKWPCQGIMKSLYMDNAREFHGKMLERACQEYGIEINFRPVKKPNYGGHIERLLGTVLRELHALPGTTFSNTKEKQYYDTEGTACFTLKELEKWLATFIVNVYHQKYHNGIQTTPLAKYNEGVNGSATQVGTGSSPALQNETKVRLDFMPYVERTIQRYGVSVDGIYYYHDVLRRWVNSFEKPNARYPILRKFIFKRDPRDISAIYFYDPDIGDYFPIPYRNTSHPSITIWEHKEILREIRSRGLTEVNEDMIFEAYAELKYIEETATGKAAAARKLRSKTKKTYATQNSVKNEFIEEEPEQVFIYDPNVKYLPFEDIEHDPFNHNTAIYR
jgi:putative transposase